MSTNEQNAVPKNCLLIFRNKKVNYFDDSQSFVTSFGNRGYFFEKISYVSYNIGKEIVTALKDGTENYDNIILYCPQLMEKAIKEYYSLNFNEEFAQSGYLQFGGKNVFLYFSDAKNKLSAENICDIFDGQYKVSYGKAYIRVIGAPKFSIDRALLSAKEICEELVFNLTVKFGDCVIETLYNNNTAKTAFDCAYRSMVAELSEYIYALDDFSVAERLFQLLKLRRMRIAVAESFTGGGISKKLVEIPGISEVYFEGLNTYSNESKCLRLGVSEGTLDRYGAVSEQTAREMAEGLIKTGNCDISIATTGIAGPSSDNTKKPVGLIYIAIGLNNGTEVYEYNLCGSRECITETAINLALFLAFKTLK